MDLAITKEAYEALDDAQKALYEPEEKDGKHSISAAALVKKFDEYKGLEKNHTRMLEETKAAKAKLKEFEDAAAEAKQSAGDRALPTAERSAPLCTSR